MLETTKGSSLVLLIKEEELFLLRYIIKRLFIAIPLLFVISFLVFSLIHLAPYDVIDSITTPNMSQETIAILRERYGLTNRFLSNTGTG